MLHASIRRLFYLVLAVSSLAGAQDLKIPDTPETLHTAPPPSDRFPAKWYPSIGDGNDVRLAPVLDKPYTAVTETSYPSPSGQTPRQSTHDFQARDRFGRTRVENQNGGGLFGGKELLTKEVQVADPVSHCDFHWTQPATDGPIPQEMRLAFVTCHPQTLRYKEFDPFGILIDGHSTGTSIQGDTTTLKENLAPLQMDGVTVNRLRVTNSRRDEHGLLQKRSVETWYSPDIRELIRIGDEKSGYTSLTNIRRVDPDPALFYPPDGYRIEQQPDR